MEKKTPPDYRDFHKATTHGAFFTSKCCLEKFNGTLWNINYAT